jgi:mono/diheme cytochrome c family protein
MKRKIIAMLVVSLGIILSCSSLLGSQTVFGQVSKQSAAEGRKIFMQNCVTCHGTSAKGDGPTAKLLKKAPADLTKIAKEDGKFPRLRIQRLIGGEDMLESHGTRDMPVWGTVLRQKHGYAFAKLEIYNLTSYIESIQK